MYVPKVQMSDDDRRTVNLMIIEWKSINGSSIDNNFVRSSIKVLKLKCKIVNLIASIIVANFILSSNMRKAGILLTWFVASPQEFNY